MTQQIIAVFLTMFAVCASYASAVENSPSEQQADCSFAPGTVTYVTTEDSDGILQTKLVVVPESEQMAAARKQFMTKSGPIRKLKVRLLPDKNGKNFHGSLSVIKNANVSWIIPSADREGTFEIPGDETYLLMASYSQDNTVVFIPDLHIVSDTVVDVCFDMADKKATLNWLLSDGECAVLPGDTSKTPNATMVQCYMKPSYNGLSTIGYIRQAKKADGYPGVFSFTTNLNDDKGLYMWHGVGQSYESVTGFNVSRPANYVHNGDTLHNDVQEYLEISNRFETFLTNPDNCSEGSMIYTLYNPGGTLAYSFTQPNKAGNKYYLCEPVEKRGFKTGLRIANFLASNTKKSGAFSPEIFRTASGMVSNPSMEVKNNNYIHPSIDPHPSFFNTYLDYNWDNTQIYGATTPYAVTMVKHNTDGKQPYYTYELQSYYANYGEILPRDTTLAKVTVFHNGQTELFSSYSNYNGWFKNWKSDGHDKGEVKILFTNSNCRNGAKTAISTCELTYNEQHDDVEPPTVQRIMMRKGDGQPTTVFDNKEDAHIDICGGDYEFKYEKIKNGFFTTIYEYFIYHPATLKVEYAPSGTNTFKALHATDNPSEFTPGFGAFWSVPLVNIDTTSTDGWFDLRITLTDASGNSQTQHLSPAFYIKSLDNSGVTITTDDDESVFEKNGRIVSTSGSEVTVFDITGANVVNNLLRPGIYIAVCNGKTSKILIK